MQQLPDDLLEAIILRLKTDKNFQHLIETLYDLDVEKLKSVQHMLETFTR